MGFEFSCDVLGQTGRCCEEDRARIGIVLGLREHVGGEEARIGLGRDDQDFGWAGDEVDADFTSQQTLGRCDVDVAGANDSIGSWDGFGSVGKRGDGLCAAHLEDPIESETVSDAIHLVDRFRAGDADVFDACYLCRNGCHDQRAGQRVAARRDVCAHGIERTHDLAEFVAGAVRGGRFFGQLLCGVAADVVRRFFNGGDELRREAIGGGAQFGGGNADGFPREAIELAGVLHEALIASLADGFEDRSDNRFRFGKSSAAAG